MNAFDVTGSPLDAGDLKRSLEDAACGACVTFEGWVRNHHEGRAVLRLEYEVYRPLAVKEGLRILEEARSRFEINKACCVHRDGSLEIGELAVWVGVSSAHRDDAFKACRYIIDQVKLRLPIWKKEHYADGEASWVNCKHCAEAANH